MTAVEDTWQAVDALVGDVVAEDGALHDAVAAGERAGMPQIQVAPPQGKLLHLIASAIRAGAILEIGTLAGYSTIWLARALEPGGRLITLELEQRHAEVARENLRRAGLDDRAEVRVGPALESLDTLQAEGAGPFDLVFIDADKERTAEYFERAVALTRDRGLVIVDNVVRQGRILEEAGDDSRVAGMRRFLDVLRASHDVSATVVQTVGTKGYDGIAVALVTRS